LEYIGHNASIRHWISYITGGEFSDKLLGYQTIDEIYYKGLGKFAQQFWEDFGWSLLAILFYLFSFQNICCKARSKITIFLFLIAFFELLNASTYSITDVIVYYIPVYIVASLLLVKIVDYLPSDGYKKLYVFLLVFSNLFFILHKYEPMIVKTNPIYQSIKRYFNAIPNDSYLYIPKPKEHVFGYHGFEASFYAEYIDFAGTNKHHIYKIGNTKGDIYIPEEFLKYIPEQNYTLARQLDDNTTGDKNSSLYKITNTEIEDGNGSLLYRSALYYEKVQNYKKAGELYQVACDNGNSFACYDLGILYDDGKGRDKSRYLAKKLYIKACKDGNFLGCLNLVQNPNGYGL
jgi:hypothetical protein